MDAKKGRGTEGVANKDGAAKSSSKKSAAPVVSAKTQEIMDEEISYLGGLALTAGQPCAASLTTITAKSLAQL